MRYLLTALALCALCFGLTACAGSSSGQATTSASKHVRDRDNDNDNNDDDAHVLYYGHAADAADRQAIATFVMRYFAAAAAANGARVCALLVPLVAETIVEEYGNSPALRGTSCAVIVSKILRREQAAIAAKRAALQVIKVRVNGTHALAILNFPELPEVRQFVLRHVNGSWRAFSFLDGIIE